MAASAITPKAIKKLQDYYNDEDDPDARQLLDWAAKQRGIRESTIEEIERGTGLKRAYLVLSIKELARLGFGKFIVGRRTQKSRMIWEVDLCDVGICAQGGLVDFETNRVGEPEGSPSSTPEDITHVFHLRPDLRISLKLPSNLTSLEAKRLADFILSLPFEQTTER